MFDTLRMGDYVRWTPALRANWFMLPEAAMWEEEPECAMEVSGLDNSSEDPCVELECVNSCGAHYIMSMTRDEYENNCLIIGDDILEQVNFSELVEVIEDDNIRYDFDKDCDAIYNMLQADVLS